MKKVWKEREEAIRQKNAVLEARILALELEARLFFFSEHADYKCCGATTNPRVALERSE